MPRDKDGRVQVPVEQYWLLATRLEAMKGLADPRFEEARAALFECAPEPWMNATTDRQIAKLADLLGVVFPPAESTSW
jgi:hypothetical protein